MAGNSSGENGESQLSFPLMGNSNDKRQVRLSLVGNSGGQSNHSVLNVSSQGTQN